MVSYATGRELFPSSDCLRGSQRESMLPREIVTYDADIVCLQVISLILSCLFVDFLTDQLI